MRQQDIRQAVAIVTDNPDEFTEQFNKAMQELRDKSPEVITDLSRCFRAVIYYTETETVYDGTVADEFHAEGLRFLCKHCPYYEDPGDKRVKHVACKYADLGRAHLEHEACEVFYKGVKNGTVRPKDEPVPLKKKSTYRVSDMKRWL